MKLFSTLYFSVALVFVLLVDASNLGTSPNGKSQANKARTTSVTSAQENGVASANTEDDSLLSAVRDSNFEKFMNGLDSGMVITEEVMNALDWNAPHRSVMSRDMDKVDDSYLLAEEHALDIFQMTPLHYAAYYNRADVIKKFKQLAGRHYDIFPRNSEGYSPLHYAITSRSWDAAKELIEMCTFNNEYELWKTLSNASFYSHGMMNEFVKEMTKKGLALSDRDASECWESFKQTMKPGVSASIDF